MATPKHTAVPTDQFDPGIKYPPLTDAELAEHGLELSVGDRCFRFIKRAIWRETSPKILGCGCCVDET